jgi:type I restriction enzyme, S subunit
MSNAGVTHFGVNVVNCRNLNLRLDAQYHCPSALEAENIIHSGPHPVVKMVDVVKYYFKPPLFKRLWVDSAEHGCQFVSGIDAYRYQAEDIRYVSYKTPNFDQFIVKKGWLTFQAAGQIYGLFGQPLYINGWLEEIFCADDIYRIVPEDEYDGAYLYAFFRTQHGQALIKRQASGNSIPRIWDPHIRHINVVWPKIEFRHEIAQEVIDIHEKIEKARLLESQAIQMTNEVITEMGKK